MNALWQSYKAILKDLHETHPLLFYMHIFFIAAALLTLFIVIFYGIFFTKI